MVGGGFAGLSAVRELREADVEVLLLDRDPYTTFQPLLYQVATGALNPGDITYALRSFAGRIPATCRFRRACVDRAGSGRTGSVRLGDGRAVGYDYLILGVRGHARTSSASPGARQARPHAPTPAPDGHRGPRPHAGQSGGVARRAATDAVEPVAVVVGGGPTGVEMAGALAELRNARHCVRLP